MLRKDNDAAIFIKPDYLVKESFLKKIKKVFVQTKIFWFVPLINLIIV